MGLASGEERIEFEQFCAQYPELVDARTNFELLLEKQAMENAEATPAHSKEKTWSVIQQSPASKTSKIVTMEPASTRRTPGLRWVAAASIILLVAAGYFAYDFYTQNKTLKDSNKELQAKLSKTDSILNNMADEQRLMKDPNVAVISMVGTQKNPSSANIYWDTTSSNVFLVVKNMPILPTEKQYQLWAFIDGKPLNLGLFDGDNKNVILKMKNTQKADAFAITIENRGNGDIPQGRVETQGKTKL
ncbi:MAG: anti-sigma factor [Bacteroidota bacterium]|nr:anti-sigma factor [Bacteroidota bacterium]